MNIISLDPTMLGDVVARAIPMQWRGEEQAKWGEGTKGPKEGERALMRSEAQQL